MTVKVCPDPDRIRQILRQYLETSGDRSSRLGQASQLTKGNIGRLLDGPQGISVATALLLFHDIFFRLTPSDRADYVKAGNLEQPLRILGVPWDVTPESAASLLSVDRMRLAGNLLKAADRADHEFQDYTSARDLLLLAEDVYTPGSAMAAQAAVMSVLQCVNLGDLALARRELERFEVSYHVHRLDDGAMATYRRYAGWVDYYAGDYSSAEFHLRQTLAIAEKAGRSDWASHHHLALALMALAQADEAPDPDTYYDEAEELLLKSAVQRHRNDLDRAYDELRLAQLCAMRGRLLAAKDLRLNAADVFRSYRSLGGLYALGDVEHEEVRVGVMNAQDTRALRRKCDAVVERWREVRLARGLSDIFRLVTRIHSIDGHPLQALESACVALCLSPYPSPNHIGWETHVEEVVAECHAHLGTSKLVRRLRRLHDAARARSGHFRILSEMIGVGDERIECAFAVIRQHSRVLSGEDGG